MSAAVTRSKLNNHNLGLSQLHVVYTANNVYYL